MTDAPADVAHRYFDALAARDADAMAACWHEDGVDELVPIGPLRGPGEVRDFFRSLFAAMPDAESRVERVVAEGPVAVVEWRLSGTFDGAPFQGIDPTGRRVEMRGCDCVEVREGRIVRNTAYTDMLGFARDVGMMPPADSPAERAMKSVFNGVTRLRGTLR